MDSPIDSIVEEHTKLNKPNFVSEEVFRTFFLPLFADLPNKHPDGTIEKWISIAGSPFAEVSVVKDNVELFKVPPIFDNHAIEPATERGNRIPYEHIVATGKQLAMRSNVEALNYIQHTLKENSPVHTEKSDTLSHVQKWNAIFTHYGLEKMSEEVTEAPAAEVTTKTTNDDFDGFTSL